MANAKVCTQCGTTGVPVRKSPGSFWIELALWCMLCGPGVIYTIWRLVSRFESCPVCGAARTMVPLGTPAAQQILGRQRLS